MVKESEYKNMWEAVGLDAGLGYVDVKFKPTYKIGLTNYVREEAIYMFLQPQAEDVVLDVGCASGRQIFKIASKIKEGYGVDIADSFVNQANKYKAEYKFHNTDFKVAVIEKLPYPDAFFDKIICAEVLEHVFDKDEALGELSRVLKTNGTILITVPNMNADGTWWGRLLRFLGLRKFTPITDFSQEALKKHGDCHVREFTGRSLSDWLSKNNFAVKNLKSASFIDGPWIDTLLKVPLHIKPMRSFLIWLEKKLIASGFLWGRHLVLEARKI